MVYQSLTQTFTKCYDLCMRRPLRIGVILFIFFSLFAAQASASSDQAYVDFRYQYDQFRQKDSAYRIAIGEYKQYNTLQSQQKATDAAKILLTTRNTALRNYLLFLNEKITENPSMSTDLRNTYLTSVTNDIAFAESQSSEIAAKTSLEDLATIAKAFTKKFPQIETDMRKISIGLQIGYLTYFANEYDKTAQEGQTLISSQNAHLTPEKKSSLDQWYMQIANKRSLFSSNLNSVTQLLTKIGSGLQDQQNAFATIQQSISSARSNLLDGVSYMKEIIHVISYE
jgi:hypothetical protein